MKCRLCGSGRPPHHNHELIDLLPKHFDASVLCGACFTMTSKLAVALDEDFECKISNFWISFFSVLSFLSFSFFFWIFIVGDNQTEKVAKLLQSVSQIALFAFAFFFGFHKKKKKKTQQN